MTTPSNARHYLSRKPTYCGLTHSALLIPFTGTRTNSTIRNRHHQQTESDPCVVRGEGRPRITRRMLCSGPRVERERAFDRIDTSCCGVDYGQRGACMAIMYNAELCPQIAGGVGGGDGETYITSVRSCDF